MRWRKRYENEFVKYLWKIGLVPVRAPNSGVSSVPPYLDIFVWCPKTGKLVAVELKTTSRSEADEKYLLSMLTQNEIEKMRMLKDRGVEVKAVLRIRGGKYIVYDVYFEGDSVLLKRSDTQDIC